MKGEMAHGKSNSGLKWGKDGLSSLKEFLDTEEGKKSIEDFFGRKDKEQERLDALIEKVHKKFGNNINEIVDKVIAKYDSDKYALKERRLGYEAREDLFWVFLRYAKKYGAKITKKSAKKYKKPLNMFTSEAYHISDYVVQRMDGQGSVVRVDKIE